MLVLMQRPGEVVVITLPDGRTVEVTVIEMEPARVRMGYTADRDIGIDRKKIYLRKRGEVDGNVE